MNRSLRAVLSSVVAATLLLAPTAAGAADDNMAFATNDIDGAAVVDASVDVRVSPSGTVDEENVAYALASCMDCQTVAVAFQLVLVPRDFHTFVPHNEAFAGNANCEECLTWASAKQVFVVTGGPANLTGAGRQRLAALEESLEALESRLPTMSVSALAAEVDAAFAEFLNIASTEIRRNDGGPNDAEVVATRSA